MTITIEPCESGKGFIAICDDYPTWSAWGETEDDARKGLTIVIGLCKACGVR